MNFRLNKSFSLFFILFVLLGFGWIGYDRWRDHEQEKIYWAEVVDAFQECSLNEGLHWMGKPYMHENDFFFSSMPAKYRSTLTQLITSGYRERAIKGLNDIWMDPSQKDSLSNKKRTPNSINLLSQCDTKISNGKLSIGLDLSYYYLYSGYSNAEELVNNLGERGITDAYVLLGHAYNQGLLTMVKDEKMAFAYYLKAANSGSTKGMLNAAKLLRSVDFEKSKKFVLAAAEEGSLEAVYILQDLTGNYRTTESGKFQSENDIKVLYFWNLVFSSLISEQRNLTINMELKEMRRSPFIWESNYGFEYDSVPNKPWHGEEMVKSIDFKIVNYYNEETVKENKNQLEMTLNSDNRIQVQGRVKKWMSERKDQSNKSNKSRNLENNDAENTSKPLATKPLKVEV